MHTDKDEIADPKLQEREIPNSRAGVKSKNHAIRIGTNRNRAMGNTPPIRARRKRTSSSVTCPKPRVIKPCRNPLCSRPNRPRAAAVDDISALNRY
jgi:hypothetical protein